MKTQSLLILCQNGWPQSVLRKRLGRPQLLGNFSLHKPWLFSRPLSASTHEPSPSDPSKSTLTLAIETSCDDTCVAILEKSRHGPAARLFFNKKITADNRAYGGVHPVEAVESHTRHLAGLIQDALRSLPTVSQNVAGQHSSNVLHVPGDGPGVGLRRKPDFVAVTRGPGMLANLATGLNTAKGLAVAWGVPLLGAHHMQAHALTPRLVDALEAQWPGEATSASPSLGATPQFPFLTLLVSGGHTQLVLSRSLTAHTILATTDNIAIGDMLDKCARAILPPAILDAAGTAAYGAALESFTFPPPSYSSSSSSSSPGQVTTRDYEYSPPPKRVDEIATFQPQGGGYDWFLTPPLALAGRAMKFDFSGLSGQVRRVAEGREMDVEERRVLALGTMKLAFEHLASRVVFALEGMKEKKKGKQTKVTRPGTVAEGKGQEDEQIQQEEFEEVRTLVVSGGVASNRFLMHVLRAVLDIRGFKDVKIVAPPISLCTDNAAMIAWAAIEMWEAGWCTEMDVLARRKWSMDPSSQDGGILGVGGWKRRNEV